MRSQRPAIAFASGDHTFRLLAPTEDALLRDAAEIDRAAWGAELGCSPDIFRARAGNGYLIAALDRRSGELAGTLSALRIPRRLVDLIGRGPTWASGWYSVTGGGTLATHRPDGDVLLCAAVTARSAARRPDEAPSELPVSPHGAGRTALLAALIDRNWRGDPAISRLVDELARWTIACYLRLDLDYVLRFHARPKPGISHGASLWRLVPAGRPDDSDAMGFNSVLCYPPVEPGVRIPPVTASVSIGVGLVSAAYDLAAASDGVRLVAPYSRPAGFRATILEALLVLEDPKRERELSAAMRTFVQEVDDTLERLRS